MSKYSKCSPQLYQSVYRVFLMYNNGSHISPELVQTGDCLKSSRKKSHPSQFPQKGTESPHSLLLASILWKSQYNFVVLGQYNNAVFPTFLFCPFNLIIDKLLVRLTNYIVIVG